MSNTPPIYALNSFIWKVLQVELGWSASSYGGKTPIIPAGQAPEFDQYEKPYIVYGYVKESGDPEMYMSEVEQAAYTIWGQSAGEINKVIRAIADPLKRVDDGAKDLNHWTHNGPLKSHFENNLLFHWTQVPQTASPGPPEQEGGRLDGLVIVRYQFSLADPVPGRYIYSV